MYNQSILNLWTKSFNFFGLATVKYKCLDRYTVEHYYTVYCDCVFARAWCRCSTTILTVVLSCPCRNVQTKSPTLSHGMSSPQFGDNINASLKVSKKTSTSTVAKNKLYRAIKGKAPLPPLLTPHHWPPIEGERWFNRYPAGGSAVYSAEGTFHLLYFYNILMTSTMFLKSAVARSTEVILKRINEKLRVKKKKAIAHLC